MSHTEKVGFGQPDRNDKHDQIAGEVDGQHEKGSGSMVELPYIDVEVEKRLLRKLDYRLPVVTGLLCELDSSMYQWPFQENTY